MVIQLQYEPNWKLFRCKYRIIQLSSDYFIVEFKRTPFHSWNKLNTHGSVEQAIRCCDNMRNIEGKYPRILKY